MIPPLILFPFQKSMRGGVFVALRAQLLYEMATTIDIIRLLLDTVQGTTPLHKAHMCQFGNHSVDESEYGRWGDAAGWGRLCNWNSAHRNRRTSLSEKAQ